MDRRDSLLTAIVVLGSVGGFLLVLLSLILAHLCWRLKGWWAWSCCNPWWDCCASFCNWCGCPTECCEWYWDNCWCWWETPKPAPRPLVCGQPVYVPAAVDRQPVEQKCYKWMSPSNNGWAAPPTPRTPPSCDACAYKSTDALYIVEPVSLQ